MKTQLNIGLVGLRNCIATLATLKRLMVVVVMSGCVGLASLALTASAQEALVLVNVDASMVTSDATFHPDGPPEGVGNPAPYGVTNNTADQGWILTSGGFTVDFGTPTAVQRFRVWSVFPGSARGALWDIEHSNDNSHWTLATQFSYVISVSGGVTDDNVPATDTTGWYAIDFNSDGVQARYWRVVFNQVLLDHAPRSAQVQFYEQVPTPFPTITAAVTLTLGPRSFWIPGS